jgi:diketogulonate reductase-like aldo/keto reductase
LFLVRNTVRASTAMANTAIKLNDNTTIPRLAFGTGTALYNKDAQDLVTAAINAGITHFDCAQVYRNEDSLGGGIEAAGKPREQLFVTTKLIRNAEAKVVRDTLVESLAKLRLEYVDLFLIHTPIDYIQEPGLLKAVWKEMEAVKKEGLARSVGVSNFRPAQLREILDEAEFPPSVNQVQYSTPHISPRYTDDICVADRVPSVCLQGFAAHPGAAEAIRDRDRIVRRALTHFPFQGWSARSRLGFYREETL